MYVCSKQLTSILCFACQPFANERGKQRRRRRQNKNDKKHRKNTERNPKQHKEVSLPDFPPPFLFFPACFFPLVGLDILDIFFKPDQSRYTSREFSDCLVVPTQHTFLYLLPTSTLFISLSSRSLCLAYIFELLSFIRRLLCISLLSIALAILPI